MTTTNTFSVHILDKEYQVACPEEQQAELITSARYLDKQMRAIRNSGKVIGLERIAVMAALNISHELLQASEQDGAIAQPRAPEDLDHKALEGLQRKIDDAMYQLRQLEIS
ncbi:cell division protein ZapA [Kineobactrum sediminis]|uniref:Cell division protein ZapA n=1 Tax=Kineobactrum sediminis TaxID=1905677 RepID=A0A2N5Y574_9GAMM|nr:cell division protein ZapA [Kineobactrum sediminis]PLW83545.1 cell division protein ZapA [Kineobactrum sediminis]